MEREVMIAIGVGSVGFVLGIINLLWGPGVLARREKIVVVESEVTPEFLRKGTRIDSPSHSNRVSLTRPSISIQARCTLSLKGKERCQVSDVAIVLHRSTCKALRRWFRIPPSNSVGLGRLVYDPDTELTQHLYSAVIEQGKTFSFEGSRWFDCAEEFEKTHESEKNDPMPAFIQPLLEKLECNYQVCFIRYDGKRLCWRFPQTWWRNLGKKL